MPHIVQIAAIDITSGKTFNSYVKPKKVQTEAAKAITRIVASEDGSMTVEGKQVQPDDMNTASSNFLKWIGKFNSVFLLAHNGRRFDYPVLLSSLRNLGKEQELFSNVLGLIDTIPVFKKCFPKQTSYRQEDLYQSVLKKGDYNAHNAVGDVKALGELIQNTSLSATDILPFSFTPRAVLCQLDYNDEKAKNYGSLASLVDKKILTKCMAEKIAGSGLKHAPSQSHISTWWRRRTEKHLYEQKFRWEE